MSRLSGDSAAGNEPPDVRSGPPGRTSRRLARRLTGVESRNVTFVSEDFPVFWEEARGANVLDADGNRFVDLTAGFAVAAPGHRHPRVVGAIREQAGRLTHGMGDVHPPAVKTRLLERLADLVPLPRARSILGSSGSEAVEAALKTARLFTGRPGVVAFTGAYHGLTYGALSVTDRAHFRAPFRDQLNPHVRRLPFPHPFRPPVAPGGATTPGVRGGGPPAGGEKASSDPAGGPDAEEQLAAWVLERVDRLLDRERERVGAVIVEPIQGRGGEVVPPPGFLGGLAERCRDRGVLLVLDEIYTGLGRTGTRFACQREGVVPDLLCVGKGLSSCLPVSACIGRREVMEAWPPSRGEAIHTSTFMGNPLACAAALASLDVIEEEELAERADRLGREWIGELRRLAERHPLVGDLRGRGLMIGLDLVARAGSREPNPGLARRVTLEALRRGWILLPGGPAGNVLSLSPPLTISRELLERATGMLDDVLSDAGADGGG